MTAPATLQAETDAETAYGGRTVTWADVASLWVDLVSGAASVATSTDAPPQRLETAAATGRDHPLAAAGQQLVLNTDPAPWRVLAVERSVPGRMTLRLERLS